MSPETLMYRGLQVWLGLFVAFWWTSLTDHTALWLLTGLLRAGALTAMIAGRVMSLRMREPKHVRP